MDSADLKTAHQFGEPGARRPRLLDTPFSHSFGEIVSLLPLRGPRIIVLGNVLERPHVPECVIF